MSDQTMNTGANRPRHNPPNSNWEPYREELISLYVYERLTLDEVIEYMQSKYGFHASVRQYQEKFRQWRARKNITGAVREEMNSKLAQGRLVVSPDEKRRLERQIRSHPERQIGSSPTVNSDQRHLISSPYSAVVSHSGNSLQGVGSIMDSVTDELPQGDPMSSPDLSLPASGEDQHVLQPWRTRMTWSASPYDSLADRTSSIMVVANAPSHGMTISPSPPRTLTLNDNAEAIFFNVKQFCFYHIGRPSTPRFANDDAVTTMSNAVVQKSTSDLKDIIYLYKIGDMGRADTFLDDYCNRPFTFVVDDSVDFLRQLITTLAPINTTRKPEVRHRILQRLHRLTKANLGPWHPFTIICKNLCLDQDSMETSIRALRVLQNSMLLCSRLLSFKTELDIVVMTRREHDYDAAMHKARLLIDTSSLVFGPDSFPVRKSRLELSNIFIAKGEYESAIQECFGIYFDHEDMLAVRAMENLAESHRLQGELRKSVTWLEASADLVVKREGRSVATTHILDKMLETLRLIGGPDHIKDIETYQKKYSVYL